jgi:tetratricopeptide (TPR) repeat protein
VSKEMAYYYNQKANTMLEEGNYLNAASYYKKAIFLLPDDPMFYHNIGVCYMLSEDYEEASIFLETALEKGIELDETKLYLAHSLYEIEKYEYILSLKEPKDEQNKINFLIIKSKAALKSGNNEVAKKIVSHLKMSGYNSQELELIEKMI